MAVGDAFGEAMFGHPVRVAMRVARRLIPMQRPWRWTVGAIVGGIVACATGEDGIPVLWRAATGPLPPPRPCNLPARPFVEWV